MLCEQTFLLPRLIQERARRYRWSKRIFLKYGKPRRGDLSRRQSPMATELTPTEYKSYATLHTKGGPRIQIPLL